MNDSAMYRALLPVLIAANPMTMVKTRNEMPIFVSRTTPLNSKAEGWPVVIVNS